MRFKNILLSLVTALLLVGSVACGGGDGDGGEDKASSDEPSAEQSDPAAKGPKPDLSGIPEVVAVVNGEKIAKDEFITAYEGQFQQMAAQAQSSGQKLDQAQLKKQTAEQMVSRELMLQESDKRGFEASGAEVDKTLGQLAKQNGMKSTDQFMAALEKQGMEADYVESEVAAQVKLDELVADEAGPIKPSEKELRALYDQMSQQQQGGQKAPPFKQVRPQLEEQVKSQKQSQVTQALVGKLRKNADVSINL